MLAAFISHPLTIALVLGAIAVGVAVYQKAEHKNLMFSRMRIEAQSRLGTSVGTKVDQEDCDDRQLKCDARFDKGDEQFRRIEIALIAIYVKQGGTPRELGL